MKNYYPMFSECFKEHHEEYVRFARENGMITEHTTNEDLKSLDAKVYAFLKFRKVCELYKYGFWTDPIPMPLECPYNATFKDGGKECNVVLEVRMHTLEDIHYIEHPNDYRVDQKDRKYWGWSQFNTVEEWQYHSRNRGFVPIVATRDQLLDNAVRYLVVFFPCGYGTSVGNADWAYWKVGKRDDYINSDWEPSPCIVYRHTGIEGGYYIADCIQTGTSTFGHEV